MTSEVKEELAEQARKIAEKGSELREEWEEGKEELKEEHDAEIEEMEYTRFSFSIDGTMYSSDWVADQVHGPEKVVKEGKPKEFAEELTDLWMGKVKEHGDFVEENTNLEFAHQSEVTECFHGRGDYSGFKVQMRRLPTSPNQIDIMKRESDWAATAGEILSE